MYVEERELPIGCSKGVEDLVASVFIQVTASKLKASKSVRRSGTIDNVLSTNFVFRMSVEERELPIVWRFLCLRAGYVVRVTLDDGFEGRSRRSVRWGGSIGTEINKEQYCYEIAFIFVFKTD